MKRNLLFIILCTSITASCNAMNNNNRIINTITIDEDIHIPAGSRFSIANNTNNPLFNQKHHTENLVFSLQHGQPIDLSDLMRTEPDKFAKAMANGPQNITIDFSDLARNIRLDQLRKEEKLRIQYRKKIILTALVTIPTTIGVLCFFQNEMKAPAQASSGWLSGGKPALPDPNLLKLIMESGQGYYNQALAAATAFFSKK